MRKLRTFLLPLCLILIVVITFTSCDEDTDARWAAIEAKKSAFNIDMDNSSLSGLSQIEIASDNPYCLSATKMFQDDEKWEVLVDAKQRSWYVNKPIKIELLSPTTYRISSFSTHNFRNVKIWVEFKDGRKFLLHDFSSMPALMRNEYQYPFSTSMTKLQTKEGNKVTVLPIPSVTANDLVGGNLVIECNDPVYKKITGIKANWLLRFGKYGENNKFHKITPIYARRWMESMTNIAYMYSSPQFKVLFNEVVYPMTNQTYTYANSALSNTGKQFHMNNGTQLKTQAEYTARLNGILITKGSKTFDLGLVSGKGGVLGLGGGSTLTVISGSLSPVGNYVITHEFGHSLGYSHSSSYCYGEFEGYPQNLQGDLYLIGDLPYMYDYYDSHENSAYTWGNATYDALKNTLQKRTRSLTEEFFVYYEDLMTDYGVFTDTQMTLIKNRPQYKFSSNKTNDALMRASLRAHWDERRPLVENKLRELGFSKK